MHVRDAHTYAHTRRTHARAQVERKGICDAMAFALDNADASGEVVEVLEEAMTIPETPVPLKARVCGGGGGLGGS